jgi:hypothetical protein
VCSSDLFGSSNILTAAYGNGLFVAAGSDGKLARSANGISWTLGSSSFGSSPILGLTYSAANALWVAVGASGKLATSSDAISWTQRSSSFGTTFINGVHASPSLFVAVGFDGKLATSTNGTSWTQRSSTFLSTTIYSIASNQIDTKFVAVGDLGKIAVSSNGTSWAPSFPAEFFGGSTLRVVAHEKDPLFEDSDVFVAAGSSGKLGTSFDGDAWIQRTSSFGVSRINDISFNPNIVVAVGNDGKIAYSI